MMFIDVKQNSEEWEALRVGKVTASNFSTFMANLGKDFGEPAKRYALQIALERITGNKAEHSFSNEHMERGHEQEPIARALYEADNFVTVTNGGFFDCGDFGDSPDGLVGDDGGIEIKSVIASTHYATLQRGAMDPAYKWQIVGHLDCTGRDWFDFVSYCSDFPESKQLLTYRITRQSMAEEIEQLRQRRADFIGLVESVIQKIKAA